MGAPNRLEDELLRTARSMQKVAVAGVRDRLAAAREAETELERAAAAKGDKVAQMASRRARVVLDALLADIDRDL